VGEGGLYILACESSYHWCWFFTTTNFARNIDEIAPKAATLDFCACRGPPGKVTTKISPGLSRLRRSVDLMAVPRVKKVMDM
jgi:hypothetical protein